MGDLREYTMSIQGVIVSESGFIHGQFPILLSGYDQENAYGHIFAEMGSALMRARAEKWPKEWIIGFHARLKEVLAKNAAYILGEEAIEAIDETTADRAVARAVAAGAVMDPETGRIPGVD